MCYLVKSLENLKTIPSLSPLASVRDHSPPTSGGKWSRNGGIGWGYGVSNYDNYYYFFNRKKQNENTEGKMSKNNFFIEFRLDLKFIALTRLNEFYPLYSRPVQPCATPLRRFFRAYNSVIEFNHIKKFNQEEVFYDKRK